MFSYFGSKARLKHLYPGPSYDKIIEPFCGAANYSCKHYQKDVWINDSWEVIYKIWTWFQAASRREIEDFPNPRLGEEIKPKGGPEGRQLLLRLLCSKASGKLPKPVVSPWAAGIRKKPRPNGHRTRDPSVFQLAQRNMLKLVGKIDHWKITNLDYSDMENEEATWFVDPPYQFRGTGYEKSNRTVDYKAMGGWCRKRIGQIIVCECAPAKWLPFVPLKHNKLQVNSSKNTYQELVYFRSDKKEGLQSLL